MNVHISMNDYLLVTEPPPTPEDIIKVDFLRSALSTSSIIFLVEDEESKLSYRLKIENGGLRLDAINK